MKAVIWMVVLRLLLAYGLDTPLRTVLFPDENEKPSRNFHRSNIHFRIDSNAVPCMNTSLLFCEELTNRAYPIKYVEKILAKSDAQKYENYFNKTVPSDNLLGVRITDDGPIELCNSFKRLIYPQLAMDVEKDWRFVIQSNQSKQAIRVEICQKKRSKCLFNESFPNGYVSACVQKYTKVPLLSLGENGELRSYDYEFPSFCQCELRYKQSNRFTGHRPF